MDNTVHTHLVAAFLNIPGIDDYNTRTTFLIGIPRHALTRSQADTYTDISFLIDQLTDMYLQTGEWALLKFIDNALHRVQGTNFASTLQNLRQQLESDQTNSPLPVPPASAPVPPIQAQLAMVNIDAYYKENNPTDSKADILLVTAAEVEAKAILSFFPKPELSHIGDQTYYDFGMIGGARTFMVQSEIGAGGQSGAILTIQEGIAALHPSAVIMVGIAFGVNEEKQHIGDILISRQIMDYDLQRMGTDTNSKLVVIPRGDRPSASPRMLSRFRAAANYWETPPKVRFGLVLSGAKLVDNQDFRDQLLKFEAEAIGGEMEGGGLYAAAQRKKVDWILVKAVCDWGDGYKKQDESQRQKEAAENAARFTKYVIEKGGFGSPMLQEPQSDVALNRPRVYQSGQAEQNSSNIKQEDAGEAVNQPSVLLQHKVETKDFDVFLSYNSDDRVAVKKIGEDLKKYGILPWLDEWELRPGLPWQRALEQQIRTIKSAAVFVGKTGMGPWHLSEMDAFLRQFKKRNCPVIPVLLPDAPQQPDLPIFLEEMSWVDFSKQEPDPLEELIWGITGKRDLSRAGITQGIQPTIAVLAERDLHSKTSIAAEFIDTGAALSNLGQDAESLEAYRQALLLDPYNALAHIGKGAALYNLKRYDEAGPAYHEAMLLAPDNVLAYVGRGYAFYARDRCDEALDVFQQALHLDPGNIDAYNGKILALSGLGYHKEALITCRQVIHLGLANAITYCLRGIALSHRHRYDEALDAYEQAIHLDAKYGAAYANQGNTLTALERYDEALAAIEQAITLDSSLVLAYNGKGNALYHLKRYEEALIAYEQAILLDPHLVVAYNNKGSTLERLGKSGEAKQAYKRARQLEIEPRFPRR